MSKETFIGASGFIASVGIADYSHVASIVVSVLTAMIILPKAVSSVVKIKNTVVTFFAKDKREEPEKEEVEENA